MSASSTPRWVLHARRFVATDKLPFLSEAIDACDDPEISKLLHSLVIHGELDANEAQPVLARLMSGGRNPEAMMLVILGLRKVALALWNADRLDHEHGEVAHASCLQLMSLSRDLGFPECEARSALTLGTYYASHRERGKAVELIRHALDLYRTLAQEEPDLYRHSVAATLNNLGGVLLDEEDRQAWGT